MRRDLAFKRIVAFEAPLGGLAKRALDLIFVWLSAPFWIVALLVIFIRRKRAGQQRVVAGDICIGYGGRPFKRLSFADPTPKVDLAAVVPINPQVQDLSALQPPPKNGFFEGLPGILNVLFGQMSLIGPKPLARADFDALRGIRKNYASARPGLLDAFEGLSFTETRRSPYGNFSIPWKAAGDFAIAGRAFARLRARLKDQASAKSSARQ